MCASPERVVSRRILRLSLRTSMVLVFLICCGFAWIQNGAKTQRDAVAAIYRSGGVVYYADESQPTGSVPENDLRAKGGLRSLLPKDYLRQVTSVEFNGNATDSDLANIGRLSGLEVLVVKNSLISDAGLRHLSALRSLKHLELQGTPITDRGLVHIQMLTRLWWLNLVGTRVTDAGLYHLSGLSRLERLRLPDGVSEDGLSKLKHVLPNTSIHRGHPPVYRHHTITRKAAD
jgi:hypothetical protein